MGRRKADDEINTPKVEGVMINGAYYEFVYGDAVDECRVCELENKGVQALPICRLCGELGAGMRLIKKFEK